MFYISVPETPGYLESSAVREIVNSTEFRSRLDACREAAHVNYSALVSLKLEALRILHAAFLESAPEDRCKFESFREKRGISLRRTSIFQTLRQHFAGDNPAQAGWHNWPEEYRDAASPVVERFAEEHAEEIDFLDWLQWVADEQLANAAQAAKKAGMAIGLYRDLAIGCDRSGAETWIPKPFWLARMSARLRTSLIRRAKTGVFRRFIRTHCGNRLTAASSSSSAPICVMPEGSASTTSWACSTSTASPRGAPLPTALVLATRSMTWSGSWLWKASGTDAL